eukprot:scaffold2612_cov267-Chaetoceros_neogracile.AAC.28
MVELGVISALAVLARARSVDIPLVSIKRNKQGGLACLISAAHRTTEEVCQRLLSMAIQF